MSIRFQLNPQFEGFLADAVSAHLETIGEDIADTAKRIAPVETGELRDSIESHLENDGKTVVISANTDYAATVEMGDATRNQPAQPYLRPALTRRAGA